MHCTNETSGVCGSVPLHALQDFFKELSAANTILIIGGGAVGIELASEIATDQPSKKVTLVHSQPSFLEGSPPRFGRVVKNYLEELGVQVRSLDRTLPSIPANVTCQVWHIQWTSLSCCAHQRLARAICRVATLDHSMYMETCSGQHPELTGESLSWWCSSSWGSVRSRTATAPTG